MLQFVWNLFHRHFQPEQKLNSCTYLVQIHRPHRSSNFINVSRVPRIVISVINTKTHAIISFRGAKRSQPNGIFPSNMYHEFITCDKFAYLSARDHVFLVVDVRKSKRWPCVINIIIILINNSRRKDKGNQWHDGGCISDTKFYWFT